MNRKRLSPRGQSLTEYLFIGALVLLVGVAAVLLIGKNFNLKLIGLKDGMGTSISAAGKYQASVAASKAAWEAQQAAQAGGATGVGAIFKGGQVCSGSFCVNLPGVQVAGANGAGGTAAKLAGVLQQIAAFLKANPDADPALVSMITNLANLGHTTADGMTKVGTCQDGTDCGGSLQVGLSELQQGSADFAQQAKAVQAFLAAHPQTLPPEMQQVVNGESNLILSYAAGFNITGTSWTYTNGPVAQATDTSSNNICRNGGAPPACVK